MSAKAERSAPVDRGDPAAELVRRFGERFGEGRGVRLSFAPGRVNLMGAHLDYNGGPVMPLAIDRGTFVALRPRGDQHLRLASTLEAEGLDAHLDELPRESSGRWYDYPLGVVRHLLAREPRRVGLDVLFGGNLPIGAGLSSSASICVGTAFALSAAWDLGLSPLELIRAALWGEREFVGVQCGIMDPYAVALTRPGHLLWLDCKDASVDHLPLDTSTAAIAVADSGIRRELARGDFNRRVAECKRVFEELRALAPGATCLRDVPAAALEARAAELDPVLVRRGRHVLAEVERTFRARDALRAGDLEGFGRLITAAHESLRDLFEVSVPELDHLVESAIEREGVLGARLTGAGFGGCVVVLLRNEAREGLVDHLSSSYERRFGRRPRVEFFRGSSGPRAI